MTALQAAMHASSGADDIGVVLGLAAGDSQRLLGIAHEAGTSLDEDEPFRLKIVGVPEPVQCL